MATDTHGSQVLLALVFGSPGAGKSTAVQALCDSARLAGVDVRRVELDTLMQLVRVCVQHCVRCCPSFWVFAFIFAPRPQPAEWDNHSREAWVAARRATVAAVQRAVSEPLAGLRRRLVVVDDNLQLRSMRLELFHTARDAEPPCACVEVLLDTPLDVVLHRNRGRAGAARVPDDVVARLHAAVEKRGDGSPKWLLERSATVDGTRSPGEVAAALQAVVDHGWGPPVPRIMPTDAEVAVSRAATASSASHTADLRLRACVSGTIQAAKQAGASPQQLKATAVAVQRARKAVLDIVRRHPTGEVDVDREFVRLVSEFTSERDAVPAAGK